MMRRGPFPLMSFARLWRVAGARTARACAALSTLVLAAALTAASALAMQPPTGQEQFVPAKNLPQTEQMPAGPLLLAAYAFIWVAVAFYVWTLWRRLNKVEGDMRALAQKTAKR
jgi:CcmD family protein